MSVTGFNIDINEKTLLIAAVLIVGAVWYGKKQLAAAGAAVNPVSADNIFNRAVTATGAAVTGEDDWTLGGSLYDLGHDEQTNAPNLLGDVMDFLTGANK